MDYEMFIKLQNDKVSGADLSQSDYDDLPQTKKEDGTMYFVDDAEGDELSSFVRSGAGFHNSIYRGDYIGSSVTAEQYDQIDAGTFNDMYIGDYWTIGGVNYRIAAFDYWLHSGGTECTDHHVVLVPDTNFTAQKMNDTNTTDGGYVGSKMHTTYLDDAKSAIETAFGSAHILTHRELLTNTVASGIAIGWAWYNSTVDLMNATMVYGAEVGSQSDAGQYINRNVGIDKSQLPLFALEPSRITNRADWWLRSVMSATFFASANTSGLADANGASDAYGVRPCFGLVKQNGGGSNS